MLKFNQRDKKRGSLLIGTIWVLLFSCFGTSISAGIRYYNRSFKVTPENAILTLFIPSGSIKVVSWDRPEIKVSATLQEDSLEVTERQVKNSVQIEVHCLKAGKAIFEINVPQICTLDIKCLYGPIEIWGAQGRVLAQTTEGSISLMRSQSNNITAKSISGTIAYNGVLDNRGIYNFHSMESSVDVTLPPNMPFTLMATSVSGNIELGGFNLTEASPHDKRISGKYAGGGASLNLSTHHGHIRLHKEK